MEAIGHIHHIVDDTPCCVNDAGDVVDLVCLYASRIDIAFRVLPLLPFGVGVLRNIHHIINDVTSCIDNLGDSIELVSLKPSGIDVAFGASLPLLPVGMEVISHIYNIVNDISGCVCDAGDVVEVICLETSGSFDVSRGKVGLPLVPLGVGVTSNVCNIIDDVSSRAYDASNVAEFVCLEASVMGVSHPVARWGRVSLTLLQLELEK